ncbi:hypothetical protein COLO4_23657 [Corchorus olitorius]|uniref:At1g61320/AtMIF1 LRR domain-containing protein n=1 Tax=Corchorus olitorius TaxID=93759 RepID=A0A1R3IFE0_9ROSI|nr:hypothetical protein COLO4_23657 [Corchorus olitorius]
MGAEELDLYAAHWRHSKTFSFEILSGLQVQPSKMKHLHLHLHLNDCSIAWPVKVSDNQSVLHSLETLELEDLMLLDHHQTVLDSIFSTCVNLWKLVLRKCYFGDLNPILTIAGPSISNLKCLQIFSPRYLRQLQVSAPKLAYFVYHSSTNINTELSFSNVPKLEEMILDLQLGENRIVDDMFTDFATDNAPQLKRLMSLHTTFDFINFEPQIPVSMAILCQLEQLELIIDMKYCNLLKMIPILVACPLLQKFHLTASGPPNKIPYLTYSSKHPFPNLKHVEIRPFYGSCGNPFVFYMLENAVALERMILDVTTSRCPDKLCKLKHVSHEVHSQQIRAKVAFPTAKLVFQHHPNDNTGFTKIFLR